ncbi:hypothetical protein CNZW441b_0124 [Campylobacter novaezeelandiae]|uniref:hypothetical protein n=1 Tax=Campylobacter novaezeelandiae TaxID=2267891 RepID=UPI001C77B78E|nr:hypothetical protein CNZW441b_0124 [Campylobacter novaezeelandiae]
MTYQFNKNEIDDFYKKIAKNVSRIRKEKGLSQLDLSLEIGYKSCSLVGGAEAGYKIYILILNIFIKFQRF